MIEHGSTVIPAKEPPAVKIKVGSKEFDTQAAADAYIQELETKASKPAPAAPAPAPVTTPVVQTDETIDGRSIEDVMIENPRRYHQYMKDQAKKIAEDRLKELRLEEEKAAATRKSEELWWEEFYKENPDLKSEEKLVKSELAADFSELAKLSPQEAKTQLAKKTRDSLKGLLSRYGVKEEELPGKKSGGIEGSPADRTRAGKAPTEKVLNFADQVRQMQRRGKTA